MTNRFKTVRDGADFLVVDATVGAASFAMVPVAEDFMFETRAEAEAQATALTGREIEVRMMETPDRFEAVADTRYGPAWD